VRTVPFVPFAGPSAGLGQAQTVQIAPSNLPFWQQILIPVGQSIGGAVSSRIAYGRHPAPYTSPFGGGYGSQFYFDPGTGQPYTGAGFGGFDPKMLLLFGGGIALLMMLSRR